MYSVEGGTDIPCVKGAMKQQLPEGQEQRGHMQQGSNYSVQAARHSRVFIV